MGQSAPEISGLPAGAASREQMNIVVVGHVDHGKSTVIGRLMADTGSLPQGKLEQVKSMCRKSARPFEYAFLLDALKDEQAQGITIDTARCFFKTAKRDYIIIDAPGHLEFLKNMVSGAARAEAALLVIDALEGIQENSRRHGYMLSMLGIRQVVVLVNKMDLIGYDLAVFRQIREDYSSFLSEVSIKPIDFVPVCARDGENIVTPAPWYAGKTVLEHIDGFANAGAHKHQPFRFPVQDIYKFTADGDDRRILAGTVETGSMQVGDEVIFLPSHKRSHIRSIEAFHAPERTSIQAGVAVGFTLADELYVKPGELMCKAEDPLPPVSSRFRANVFWMGKAPLLKKKQYKLKLATLRSPVRVVEIVKVLDASDLTTTRKQQVDRHEVAECVFETTKPIAFDCSSEIESTSRFVLVDNYEIAGGGLITESLADSPSAIRDHVRQREAAWESSEISPFRRAVRFGHKPKFLVITGDSEGASRAVARALEAHLFDEGHAVYYLGLANVDYGLDADVYDSFDYREERIRRIGELARILTDSGQIFIASIPHLDAYDVERLKVLNQPNEILIVGVNPAVQDGVSPDVTVAAEDTETAVTQICALLKQQEIIPDYSI